MAAGTKSRQVKVRAKAYGHSDKALRRARERLSVEDRREGFPAVSEWRLPVAPSSTEAEGTTGEGTTALTRILEPKPGDLAPQSCPPRRRGTSGATSRLNGSAFEAQVRRRSDRRPPKKRPRSTACARSLEAHRERRAHLRLLRHAARRPPARRAILLACMPPSRCEAQGGASSAAGNPSPREPVGRHHAPCARLRSRTTAS